MHPDHIKYFCHGTAFFAMWLVFVWASVALCRNYDDDDEN